MATNTTPNLETLCRRGHSRCIAIVQADAQARNLEKESWEAEVVDLLEISLFFLFNIII